LSLLGVRAVSVRMYAADGRQVRVTILCNLRHSFLPESIG
jgi:hypothetical protein